MKKFLSNKKNKILVIATVLLGLGLGAYSYIAKSSGEVIEETIIKEQKVKSGNIKIDFIGDGEAQISVVNLDFEISGKLEELYVSNGQQIKAGDVVAKLDDTDYVNKLKSTQAEYQKAVTKLEQAKENHELEIISEKQKLDELKSKLDQIGAEYLPMLEIKEVYSEQVLEIKKASYESAKSAYEAQLQKYNIILNGSKNVEMEKANVEAAKISLEIAKNDLNKTVLTAPIDATILNISYKPGESIPVVQGSGDITSDTNHFMIMSDSDKVEVKVPVSEIDLANVGIGQNVEVEFEAYESQLFTGKVLSIDSLPLIDNNGLVTYDAILELDGGIDKIKTGMTGTVSFILNQRQNVLVIPNKAVGIEDGKQVVKVKNEDGNIETRFIKTGLTNGTNVEVTDGLKVGETLIIEENK